MKSPGMARMWLLLAMIGGSSVALALSETPLWAAVSGFVIACSLCLMQESTGLFNFRILTIPGFCYVIYVFIVVIPSFWVFSDKQGSFRVAFLFAVESALITIPLGIMLAKHFFHFGRSETLVFFEAPIQEGPSEPTLESFFVLLTFVLVLSATKFFETRTVPLFYLLSHPGEFALVDRLREETGKLSDSPLNYLYGISETILYPFLIVLAFGKYLHTKRWSWALCFWASFIPGLLFIGSSTAKAPVARIFLVLCGYFYLWRRGKVEATFGVSFIILFFAFPIFVTLQKYSGFVHLGPALQEMGRRLFYAPAECLYYYFEVFPHVVPYQHGATIGKFAMLIGQQPFDAANVVGRYMEPKAFFTTNATAPFLGSLNADFGMIGVLLGGILAGAVMQAAQSFVVRSGKSVLALTMYVLFLRSLMDISTTALAIVLMSSGTAFVFLLKWTVSGLDSVVGGALRTSHHVPAYRLTHDRRRHL